MGQNFCQQRPLQSEFQKQEELVEKQAQAKENKQTKQQPAASTENALPDEPDPSFATKTQTTNFLLPANVQQRLIELKSFSYPQGADVPTGKRIVNPYLLQNGSYYAGDWKVNVEQCQNGKMHGKGLFVLPDKSLLTCVVKQNVICKKARIIYPNGDYFEGDVQNNKANGKGKLVQGKTIYKGGFKDNLQHGTGTQTGDGYTFQGEFQNGQKKNGALTWKKDKETFTYKGQFFNNLFEGRGTLTTNEGRYIGQFSKGQKCGKGKFYYKNHRYYDGQFDNDMRHGQGKVVDQNQSKIVLRGRWQNDIFLQS